MVVLVTKECVLVLVAIVRSNSLVFDSRLMKIGGSLSKKYTVLAIGWNREGRKFDQKAGFKNVLPHNRQYNVEPKILGVRAPYARPTLKAYIPLIVYFPLFWSYILFNLFSFRPDIVHACDLDTALPCYIYKVLFRKKMVFDVFDRYAMTFIPKKHTILYSLINLFEDLISARTDVLVTVNEKILDSFRKKPVRCRIIMNCMEDYYFEDNKNEQADGSKPLTLIYTGPITYGRGLQIVSEAIKGTEGVRLTMLGPLVDKNLLEELLINPRVEYKGFLESTHDYFHAVLDADILIALYSEDIPVLLVTTHNKIYEAMMCGKPVITNVLRDLIAEANFGIIVHYESTSEIRSAIIKLKNDKELRKQLGKNGRNAFLQKYNWAMCEIQLLDIYEALARE